MGRRRSRSRDQRGRPRRERSRRRPCRSRRPWRRPSASVAIAEATVVAIMAITQAAPTTRPIRRHTRLPAASPSPPRRAPRPITTPSTTGRSRVAKTPLRTARRIGSRCMLPLFVPRSGRPRRRFPTIVLRGAGSSQESVYSGSGRPLAMFSIGGGGRAYDGSWGISPIQAPGSVDHGPFVSAKQVRDGRRLRSCRRCGVHRDSPRQPPRLRSSRRRMNWLRSRQRMLDSQEPCRPPRSGSSRRHWNWLRCGWQSGTTHPSSIHQCRSCRCRSISSPTKCLS